MYLLKLKRLEYPQLTSFIENVNSAKLLGNIIN